MKKTCFFLIFSFLVSFLFLSSCGKTPPSGAENLAFLKEGNVTYGKMRLEERWEEIGFSYSKDSLTLRFTDPDSPLFTLEEIVTEDGVFSSFEGISYEMDSSIGFSGIISKITCFMQQNEPIKIKKEKDFILKTYEDEGLSFSTKETKKHEILFIEGVYEGNSFEIKLKEKT